MGIWRRGRARDRSQGRVPERPRIPEKDHVHASTEDRLIQRLRQLELPPPPPEVKERSLRRYRDWLEEREGRQGFRD